MIDWHSHILPGIDDGSKDVAESLSLLQMLSGQGITTVVATPHFYADRRSVPEFLARRAAAEQKLAEVWASGLPEIRCGAEVRYYPGISRLEGLRDLQIAGTELLLLEMPESRWTEYTVQELLGLAGQGRMRILLAHVERCMEQQSGAVWNRLLESGILMQTNAEHFLHFFGKNKAVSLLQQGRLHLLGSDCHNLAGRPPRIGRAMEIIRKKLGEDFLDQMDWFGNALLQSL